MQPETPRDRTAKIAHWASAREKGQRLEVTWDSFDETYQDERKILVDQIINNTRQQIGMVCPTCRCDAASVHMLIGLDSLHSRVEKRIKRGKSAARKLDDMIRQVEGDH